MKMIDENAQMQIESLLNECKGNLFEFLVAQHLSKLYGSEDLFLLNLHGDYRKRLQFYEQTVRHHNPGMLVSLSPMAQSVAKTLEGSSYFIGKKKFSFFVIGKLTSGSDSDFWNETDIVASEDLGHGESQKLYLSLKLTKDHSFTNTKSAGVKSFIEKYFNKVDPTANFRQTSFNKEVDESFFMMGHKLYEMIDQDFKGSFDSRFTDHYSELPGELSQEMRKVIHQNYFRVITKLKMIMNDLYTSNPIAFFEALGSLCGFGNKDIIQVSCIHLNNELKNVYIKAYHDLFGKEENSLGFSDIEPGGSSFEIRFKKINLQIRIKPMNKFTTAAYKVNCSIKMKGESLE